MVTVLLFEPVESLFGSPPVSSDVSVGFVDLGRFQQRWDKIECNEG